MGELWIQTCIVTTFRCDILCILTLITRKLKVISGHSTYRTTALLLEVSIFCVRAGFEIQLVSYGSKHASQSLSSKPFVRTCTHNLKTTGHIWMSAYQTTALLLETFLVLFRVAWEIRQLESYGLRHTLVVLWYNIVCVYCRPIHTSLIGAQLCMTTKLMYVMTAYYTPKDGLTANYASFYKNKVS